MTSSLPLLQFRSVLAAPKDMHSAEKARLEMLLREMAVLEWAGWPEPTPQPIRQAQQASPRVRARRREGGDG